MFGNLNKIRIVSIDVNIFDLTGASEAILRLVIEGRSSYICVANVHVCMEAYDDAEYKKIINQASLVIPDGMPLVWAQKLLGGAHASRVRGPDLMVRLCSDAERKKLKIGLYGGSDITLKKLRAELSNIYPSLEVVISISPPFRSITEEENLSYAKEINDAGVHILFVGLGCPKQERWMFNNRHQLNCVSIGVGAAFDFVSGDKKTAPMWMQKAGFEWLFRFLCEPKRLWKRYLKHNPRFVALVFFQLFKSFFSIKRNNPT